jgi:hypothetical protein
MIPYHRCGFRGYPFMHPSGGSCFGIHIEQTAPGWIVSQYGIEGSLVGLQIRCQADLSVSYAGKGPGLKNNLLKSIGKLGRFHSVQYNGSYCHLADGIFPSGFAVNDLCQQMDILSPSMGYLGYLVYILSNCRARAVFVLSQTQPR